MKTEEFMFGEVVDSIITTNDADACAQLMHRTGQLLNMLSHCAQFHRKVLTAEYLGDVWEDLSYLQMKFNLPEPKHPAMQ